MKFANLPSWMPGKFISLLFILFPVLSFGVTQPACLEPIVGTSANIEQISTETTTSELIRLGAVWFVTGNQKGPYAVDWKVYVGQLVRFEFEIPMTLPDGKRSLVEFKLSQKLFPLDEPAANSLPSSLVNAVRADATAFLPTGKPLQATISFQDVIVYAAKWGGKWHKTRAIRMTQEPNSYYEELHGQELEKLMLEARNNNAEQFAVLGVSENGMPILPNAIQFYLANQVRELGSQMGLTCPVSTYQVPWKAPKNFQDFVFFSTD
jgi:hypothetical protein